MAQDAGTSAWPPPVSRPPGASAPNKLAQNSAASRPIFAVDPLVFKRDKTSSAISFVIHTVVIALVLSLTLKARTFVALNPTTNVTPVDFKAYIPPITLPVAKLAGGGGGYGGGLMSVGGGVAAPEVIHSVEPEFTEDARRANFQGSVSIKLIVDSQGTPQDVRLVRHLGMGLDEKAIEAVKQYRFKPAMYQGHPVSVQIVIDVDFHLH